MGWADYITIDEVHNARTWADYCRQTAGIPYPSQNLLNQITKESNILFEQYPNLSWRALCQLALWAKAKKRRFANGAQLIRSYRKAYQDGYLAELDADYATKVLDERVTAALLVETSPEWRRRLLAARGPDRERVYDAWAERMTVA